MSEKVTFNFVVKLGPGDKSPSAEIDTRTADDGGLNAKNSGKTSGFGPTDKVYFLLWRNGFELVKAHVNIGTVAINLQASPYKIREEITFNTADGLEGNLSKPPISDGALTPAWFGTNLGTLSNKGQLVTLKPATTFTANSSTSGGDAWAQEKARLLISAGGVARVEYTTSPESWKISLPNEQAFLSQGGKLGEDYPIVVTLFMIKPKAV